MASRLGRLAGGSCWQQTPSGMALGSGSALLSFQCPEVGRAPGTPGLNRPGDLGCLEGPTPEHAGQNLPRLCATISNSFSKHDPSSFPTLPSIVLSGSHSPSAPVA